MGGEIKVTTKKDTGTVFELLIKTETSDLFNSTLIASSNRSSLMNRRTDFCGSHQKFSDYSSTSTKTSQGKVLIADDDDFNLMILESHLTKLQKEVIRARDGQELIEVI